MTTPLPISAFVICQDEEAVIEACIRSVAMCAQIVVVDSGSTDGTIGILQRLRDEDGLPVEIVHEDWRGYGAQKQFALGLCTQPWCLSIDGDERVSRGMAATLPDIVAQTETDVWKLTRYDYLLGYGYVPPGSHDRFLIRLFRRGKAWFDPDDLVHEGMRTTSAVRKLKPGGLLHFRPLTVAENFTKENKYSSLKARMRHRDGVSPKPGKMLVSPLVYFIRLYMRQGLWRCGWAGFIHATKGAIYSFLTEAKRWETDAVARKPVEEPDWRKLDRY